MATQGFDPRRLAATILHNVEDVDANRITWDEFSARNRAAWDEAMAGEMCIVGSACAKRVSAVHAAMEALS